MKLLPTIAPQTLIIIIANILFGALLAFSFAPYDHGYLALLALSGMCFLWQHCLQRAFFWHGLLFAMAYFGVGVHWVYISLYYFGELSLLTSLLINFVLVIFLALFVAIVAQLVARYSRRRSLQRALLIAVLWSASEFARAYLFSGFPWLSIGYSQWRSALGNFAPLGGVFTVGLLTITLSSLAAYAASSWLVARRRQSLAAIAVIVALLALGELAKSLHFVTATSKKYSVALIQGNISQENKFDPRTTDAQLQRYVELITACDEEIIILPETAFVLFEHEIQDDILTPLQTLLRNKKQVLLTGIPSKDARGNYYNAIIAVGAGTGRYYKNHLLPFGEYQFPALRYLAGYIGDIITLPLADFSAGGERQQPLTAHGTILGASICFEAAFGREIRRSLPRAQFLVNVSNDGWFKDSIAGEQHLQMNQMRALETGREMARATNTGISAFIDVRGRVTSRAARDKELVLSATITPYIGVTPYVRWGNLPFGCAWLAYVIIIAFVHFYTRNYALQLQSSTN